MGYERKDSSHLVGHLTRFSRPSLPCYHTFLIYHSFFIKNFPRKRLYDLFTWVGIVKFKKDYIVYLDLKFVDIFFTFDKTSLQPHQGGKEKLLMSPHHRTLFPFG